MSNLSRPDLMPGLIELTISHKYEDSRHRYPRRHARNPMTPHPSHTINPTGLTPRV
jgi:hypothetical protein